MLKIAIMTQPDIKKVGTKFIKLDLTRGIKETIELIIRTIERYAKQITPVDTGRLRASIGGGVFRGGHYPAGYGIKIGKFRGEIGTNVKYAPFVHWGTKYMRARPFLSKSAEFAVRKLSGKPIEDRLSKELRIQLSRL